MKKNILDASLDVDEFIDLIKSEESPCVDKLRKGYYLMCFALPYAPNIREVGGTSIVLTKQDKSISIKFNHYESAYAGIILATEYVNYWENIVNVVINSKSTNYVTLNDIYTNNASCIEINYKSENWATISNSSVYYVVSPYKHDAYYLNKLLDKWSNGNN